MKFKELKEFLEKLTPDQLDCEFGCYSTNTGVTDAAMGISQLDEDLYYIDGEDGLLSESQLVLDGYTESEIEDMIPILFDGDYVISF